jgi:D-arabinose 1-dehydrogenase-like Zn-dependent alcohol dehydrogenase
MKTTEEHPNEFRAAQFTQAGEDLEITQIPWRDPAEGEVVVKVIACGVARS